MWALGVYDLGLSDSQFSSLTPRHFDALLQRFLQQQERDGALVTMYANVHRDTARHPQPYVLQEFVPTRRPSAAVVAPDHCQECGLHEYYGHTEECTRGRELVQFNLSQMMQFTKAFPTVHNGG
jgi:hypothetical protein